MKWKLTKVSKIKIILPSCKSISTKLFALNQFDIISTFECQCQFSVKAKEIFKTKLKRTHDRNIQREELFRNQNKYFCFDYWLDPNITLFWFFFLKTNTYIVCTICPTKDDSLHRSLLNSWSLGRIPIVSAL